AGPGAVGVMLTGRETEPRRPGLRPSRRQQRRRRQAARLAIVAAASTRRSGYLVDRARILGQWRRLILGETSLQGAPREHADEPSFLSHRHALEIVVLEKPERLVKRQAGVEREPWGLGDLAYRRRRGVAAGRDDVPHQRSAGDHPREPLVLAPHPRPPLPPP